MSTGSIRIAVAGAGRIGRWYCENISGRLRNVQLVGVVDPLTERGAAVANELGIVFAPDLEEMVRKAAPDALLIASSSDTHADLIHWAADLGLHVFCEKPLATDIRQGIDAVLRMKEQGLVLRVGFQRRFDRGIRALRDMIAQEKIGHLILVKSLTRDPEVAPLEYLKVSGGIYFDEMIHDLDVIRFVSGSDVHKISAIGDAYLVPELRGLQDADVALAVGTLTSGAMFVAEAARRSGYGYDVRAEVFGTGGCASVELQPDPPIVQRNEGRIQHTIPYWFLERFADAYISQISVFADTVLGNIDPTSTQQADGIDGLKAMLIAEAARQAWLTGAPVDVDYSCLPV